MVECISDTLEHADAAREISKVENKKYLILVVGRLPGVRRSSRQIVVDPGSNKSSYDVAACGSVALHGIIEFGM